MATTNLISGQAVIDLGNFGKLILPVEVDGGHWFYYWDRSGDGSAADTGSLNGGVDFLTRSDLIALFKQDVNNSTNASGTTDNTYRYGWLNDVHLALPTVGGVAIPPYGVYSLETYASGSSIGSSNGSNTTNTVYNDYLAVWDAYNGTPPGWAEENYWKSYWTATPAGSTHSTLTTWSGYVGGGANDESKFYVALEVLFPTYAITTNSASQAEGEQIFFNVATTNLTAGTTLNYTLTGVQANDILGGSLTGTVNIDAQGNASIPVALLADQTTEGAETLTVTLQGQTASTIVNDTSKTQVNVAVSPIEVRENGAANLVYTFTRTGDTSSPLTVNFDVTGSANSNDYAGSINTDPVPTTLWTKLWGTTSNDISTALTDGNDGAIYIAGITGNSLDGQRYSGSGDAFITRYQANGTKDWTKLLGSSEYEYATALSTGTDGAIYLSGYSDGTLDGQIKNGSFDAFISKYQPDGSKDWTKLFGTSGGDTSNALTAGLDGSIYSAGMKNGGMYPSGGTSAGVSWSGPAYITKFLPDGSIAWSDSLGTSGSATALTTGLDGSIYLGGNTNGSFDGQTYIGGSSDFFITKYQPNGTKVWTKILGSTARDGLTNLTTGPDGSIYAGGFTQGSIDGSAYNGGYIDSFLAKFQPDGSKSWLTTFGQNNNGWEQVIGLTAGLDGRVYVTNDSSSMALLTEFLPDGTKVWTKYVNSIANSSPSSDQTHSSDLIVGADGSLYVGGYSEGYINDQVYIDGHGSDIFISKLSVLPQITFASGSLTATLQITPVVDQLVEAQETVVVNVLSGTGYDIGTSALATGAIQDPPTYQITTSASNVNEGSSVTFNVVTTNVSQGTTLHYTLSGVQANDILGGSLTGTINIDAQGKASIPVALLADQTTEGNETLVATVQGQTASVTVNDTSIAQVPPVVSFATAASSANEGHSGNQTVNITANLSSATVRRQRV